MQNLIITAIDPSLTNTGICVYNLQKNRIELSQTLSFKDSDKKVFRNKCLKDGLITEENEKNYFTNLWKNERLSQIFELIEKESREKKSNVMLCEGQFGAQMHDTNSVPKVVAGSLDMLYSEWKPLSWKKILTGNGKCSQDVINDVVKKFVGIYYTSMTEHEIDAWSLVLTFLKLSNIEVREIKP